MHLTETAVWARHGGRTVDRPAGVMVDAAGLVVGVDRAMAVGDDFFEPAPIRYVDDEVLLLGATAVSVHEVFAALLAHAVAAAGACAPVDLLVLTCPTGWGTRRRRVLAAAGRAVAREVRVIAVADAVTHVIGGDAPGIVVEVGLLASSAWSTDGGTRMAVDAVGAMDVAEHPDAGAEIVSAIHDWRSEAPAWVVLTGELSVAAAGILAGEVNRRWGALPRVREFPGGAVVDGAYSWALDLAGPRAPDPEPGPRTRRPVAWRLALGAVLAAAVGTGVVAWAASRPDAPGSAATPVVELRAASGRAAVTVPAGWVERAPASRPDRAELVRVDGRPARILLVHKELEPGADLDAVAGTLADRIAARADTFTALEHVEVDARPALTYQEFPDPDSQVRWQVFVTDGLQVSIGCQAPRDRLADLEPECAHVVRSVTVEPR